MISKAQLRNEIAHKRAMLDVQWLETASARVVENIQTLDAFKTAKTIALYKAIAGEVLLEPLFAICWKLGKRTCIPVFNPETKRYEMAEVAAEARFSTGHYGIQEPLAASRIAMDAIDLVAVPGVAFDRNGNRLGRGGGYYDRLLADFTGLSAAVAFDFQILPTIPCEPHDRPIDAIITESGIVNVLNER